MKPKSYTVQDGCHNCDHAFAMLDYEAGPEYFCNVDQSERPPCGSGCNREYFGHDTETFRKGMRKWDKWSEYREVRPWGRCDDHRERQT